MDIVSFGQFCPNAVEVGIWGTKHGLYRFPGVNLREERGLEAQKVDWRGRAERTSTSKLYALAFLSVNFAGKYRNGLLNSYRHLARKMGDSPFRELAHKSLKNSILS